MSIENNPLTDTPLWLPEEWKDNKHPLAVQIAGTDAGWKVTYTLTVPMSSLWLFMPDFGTGIGFDTPDIFANLRLTDVQVSKPGGTMATVRIVFDPPGMANQVVRPDKSTQYTLDDGGIELALEKHDDYVTCWNHSLISKSGTTQAKPEGWASTKTTVISLTEWEWVQEDVCTRNGWVMVEKRKKPADYFVVSAPVVNQTTFYRLQGSANGAASGVGAIATPGNTFGITGGNWLKRSASVQYDGANWQAVMQFQHCPLKWDTDLYD